MNALRKPDLIQESPGDYGGSQDLSGGPSEGILRLPTRRRATSEGALILGVAMICFGSYLGGWAISIGHGILFIGLVLALIEYRSGPGKAIFSGPRASTVCLLAFVLLAMLSLVIHWNDYSRPLSDLKKFRYWLIPLGILLIAGLRKGMNHQSERTLRIAIPILCASIILATISGLVGHFTGYNPLMLSPDPQEGRAGGVYSQVMTYSYSMQFSVLLLISIVLLQWRDNRLTRGKMLFWLAAAAAIVGIIGLYFSYSRGAVLGFLVGGGLLLVTLKAWRLLAGTALLGSAIVVIAIAGEARFVTLQEGSDRGRINQWRAAAHVFMANPVSGVGFRQLEKNFDRFKAELGLPKDVVQKVDGEPVLVDGKPAMIWYRGHAHNNVLEAFAGSGSLAGLAFIAFCFFWARETWKSRWGRYLFFPSVAAFIVSGCFENTFYDGEVLALIMLLYVASQITLDHEQAEDDEKIVAFPKRKISHASPPAVDLVENRKQHAILVRK